MPSKRTISIHSISRDKKGIYIVKAGPYSFRLSEDAFTNFYLREGKEITESEIRALKEESSLSSLRDFAIASLSKKQYSKHEMKQKLLRRNPNEKAVFAVIKSLETYGLLNDESYAKDYKDERENALYGKKRILEELQFKKGISPCIFEHLVFSHEKDNAKKYILSLSRSLSSYPLLLRTQKAKNALMRRGFDKDAIDFAIRYLGKEDDKKVQDRLEKDASGAYVRYARKYNNDYELFSHLWSFLLRKGYQSEDISNVVERIKHEH